MGSYFGLEIKGYDIISGKSYLTPEIGILFSENEKLTFPDKDDEEYIKYIYKSSAGKLLKRLSIIGITPEKAKKEFYIFKQKQIEDQTDDGDFWGDVAIKSLTFPKWCNTIKEIIENKKYHGYWSAGESGNPMYNYMLENEDFLFGFPTDDYRKTLSVILSIFESDEEVILDLSSLIHGGYYEENENFVDLSRNILQESKYTNERIILLTEGTFDSFVLRETLNLLYPDYKDYFSFLDFENTKTPGGAGQLVNYIRALSGAKITDKIIAIFDNDSAAFDALRNLSKTKLPKNIYHTNYPNLDYLKSYPTIGPTGKRKMNINGKAGSVEMYLGNDILDKENELFPIQWKGYIVSLDRYQGEAIDKVVIQKKFKEKLKKDKENEFDWTGIESIWENIFDICKNFNV